MTLAKITSFFGGFFYLLLFGCALIFSEVVSSRVSEGFGVSNSNLFALILASAFLIAVGNFCFSYFLQTRESYHETMDSAFFFSLQLLITPTILFVGFVVLFVSLDR